MSRGQWETRPPVWHASGEGSTAPLPRPQGVDEKKPLGDLWSLDTETRTWEQIEPAGGQSPPPRSYHAMTAHGGSLFVFGGCGTAGRLNNLWAFDVADRTWRSLPASDAIKARVPICEAPLRGSQRVSCQRLPCHPSRRFFAFPCRLCPQGRGGSTLAAAGGSLWVVAGFCGHELSDTHRFDLATQQCAPPAPSDPGGPPAAPPLNGAARALLGALQVGAGGG